MSESFMVTVESLSTFLTGMLVLGWNRKGKEQLKHESSGHHCTHRSRDESMTDTVSPRCWAPFLCKDSHVSIALGHMGGALRYSTGLAAAGLWHCNAPQRWKLYGSCSKTPLSTSVSLAHERNLKTKQDAVPTSHENPSIPTYMTITSLGAQ